ncbi:hypothetical protein IKN40_05375, partial [bacterium]|nr:hypothetical protein [bacterium]
DKSAKTLITNTSTDSSYYLTFVNSKDTGQRYAYVNNDLYYNPNTKTLNVTNINGNINNASYFKVSEGRNGSYNLIFSSVTSGNASAYISNNLKYDYTNNILSTVCVEANELKGQLDPSLQWGII